MTLSTSRQQFLAYESQTPEDIQYGRRGGIFISNCICISFIFCAVIAAVIVGVIVHFITFFKLSQKTVDFWDETEPFGLSSAPSPDLRLPSYVVPSFYRLKLKAELENSTYSGDVYITIRASRSTKEIILHSKNLSISSNAKLTEQIYEKIETLQSPKVKRDVEAAVTATENVTAFDVPTTPATVDQNATESTVAETTTVASNETTLNMDTTQPPTPVDTEITHSAVRTIKILSIIEGTGDRLLLSLESALKTNVDYILQLSFESKISNSLTGFYKSTYINDKHEEKNLGVTQFEPTSARSAFPCFDEPAFKANFEISIAHPETVTALSNMKIVAQEPIPDQPGWQWTHFDRSVSMSTYLVAYVLSDFKSLETSYTSKDNITIPIKIWTRPELIGKAKYASTITPKLLAYYEEVFGVPYALDKMDLIAIPDFSSGAMENWGLVTFRETTLLFDEAESVPRDKQNVAIDIAHELAHQWFGNLVTMRWWTDLWLNEGFATYIEYVGVDHVEPEWNMFESFSRDKMDLLRSDALKNTSPVSRKVVDASEISQKFDEISYTKGANLIRMLNHTISEELFHKGLVIYLNLWKYSNAEENDLWDAMSRATMSDPTLKDLSVVQFMNSWTRQAGYPVVNVNRNYDNGHVEFEQRLFTSATDPYQKMIDQLWHIPISYTVVDSPVDSWSTKPKTWLKGRISTVTVPINDTQALYVNVDAIGYYRVNYDKKNWQLLSEALKAGHVKSPITKSQLIDDAFNLAKVSQLDYSYALGLTTCVINGEDSKMVWDLLLNNMAFLRHNMRSTSGYVYFQDYMRIILAKQLERVNYGLSKPKDDNEAFLIENLVMWECYVEAPRCLAWAREQFRNWTAQHDVNNNPIPSYLRSLVYNMALRHGGRAEFDFLWDVFVNSTDPNVKSLVINNLPSTREESLITMLLEKSLTEIPKQYAVAAWSVEPPLGSRLAQDFLVKNFDRVYNKFTQMDAFTFPAVLSGAFGFISTEEELSKLKSFALKHKEQLMPMSQTLQKLVDTATFRIDWIRKHSAGISRWFKDYVSGKLPISQQSTVPPTSLPADVSSAAAGVTSPPAPVPTTAAPPA
ncbi:aminopeptidase N-like isoform X1 [Helicoverpa zea]|uniref:aminopeptidase N-like isoform X1 n=1 Tax=Helicoverpa zea TaxID=7113 RepID=UPI001F562FFD|nr:aminopeptidase N-like isoform X1 [Helicoverpa zea]